MSDRPCSNGLGLFCANFTVTIDIVRSRSSATTDRRCIRAIPPENALHARSIIGKVMGFQPYAESAWSSACACCRSSVSKPSVNQP